MGPYLCRATGGAAVCGSDADAAAWVGLGEFASYGVANATVKVIQKAVSRRST